LRKVKGLFSKKWKGSQSKVGRKRGFSKTGKDQKEFGNERGNEKGEVMKVSCEVLDDEIKKNTLQVLSRGFSYQS